MFGVPPPALVSTVNVHLPLRSTFAWAKTTADSMTMAAARAERRVTYFLAGSFRWFGSDTRGVPGTEPDGLECRGPADRPASAGARRRLWRARDRTSPHPRPRLRAHPDPSRLACP